MDFLRCMLALSLVLVIWACDFLFLAILYIPFPKYPCPYLSFCLLVLFCSFSTILTYMSLPFIFIMRQVWKAKKCHHAALGSCPRCPAWHDGGCARQVPGFFYKWLMGDICKHRGEFESAPPSNPYRENLWEEGAEGTPLDWSSRQPPTPKCPCERNVSDSLLITRGDQAELFTLVWLKL